MDIKELRNKTVVELQKELLDKVREQFSFRMMRSAGQLAKPHLMKEGRRTIARIKTALREKQVKS